MQFGVFDQNDYSGGLIHEQYDHRLSLLEMYDELGFDVFQMSEHHGTPLSTAPSPSVFLAAASQRTRKIRLCPLVYLIPIYNPVRLAEEILMLDNLTKGRFEFGVGRGASPHELRFLGVEQDGVSERYTEGLEVMVQALGKQSISFQGSYHQLENVPIALKPFSNITQKMWYAAGSPESALWPARNGYNLMTGGPITKVAGVISAYFEERARVADGRETLAGLNRYVVVGETDKEAEDAFLSAWNMFFASFIHLWNKLGGKPKNAVLPEDGRELLKSGIAVAGTGKTVGEALRHQRDVAGMNFISANLAFGSMPHEVCRHSIQRYSEIVMPMLRAA